MKLKCLHCGYEFNGSIEKDKLGWHSSCPKCECSFDVDYSEDDLMKDLLMEQKEQM